ncbi:MAG: hypothetical protein QXZ02_06010 [Candidatus Bathyarchaeia archaeon]
MFGLENWLTTLISYELTVAGLMLASVSFLLKEYLVEERKIALKKRSSLFFALILSLLIVPLFLTGIVSFIVALAEIPTSAKTVFTIVALSPLVPIAIIIAILWRS